MSLPSETKSPSTFVNTAERSIDAEPFSDVKSVGSTSAGMSHGASVEYNFDDGKATFMADSGLF